MYQYLPIVGAVSAVVAGTVAGAWAAGWMKPKGGKINMAATASLNTSGLHGRELYAWQDYYRKKRAMEQQAQMEPNPAMMAQQQIGPTEDMSGTIAGLRDQEYYYWTAWHKKQRKQAQRGY